MVYDVMDTLACAPAVGDGDYVAGAEGGVGVVDKDVDGFVEFLRGGEIREIFLGINLVCLWGEDGR